jgi:hypothetical protein
LETFLRALPLWPTSIIATVILAAAAIGLYQAVRSQQLNPFLYLQIVAYLLLTWLGSIVCSRIAPPGRAIPPRMLTIGREGWEAIVLVLAIFTVIAGSLVPVVVIPYYLANYPQTTVRVTPLAFAMFGLAIGLAFCWFWRHRISGPLDAMGIIGFPFGVMAAIGAAIPPLFP